MAKTIIPAGKRRYSITLTTENYDWLRHLVVTIGKQPRSQIAVTIDEMIGEMKEALDPILKQYEKTGKQPSWADFHIMLGKQLQKIGDEEQPLNL